MKPVNNKLAVMFTALVIFGSSNHFLFRTRT